MDREKQKKLEQERMEKESSKVAKVDHKEHEPEEEGDGPRLPRKSKFDSDDEANDDDDEKVSIKKESSGRSPSPPAEDSEPEMTEEEKEFQLMIITKTLLTEILLEVTNEEIQHVAKETHRKATRGLLLISPENASSMLFTKTHLNVKRIRHVHNLFKTQLNNVLSDIHGRMSDEHFQPFSANASGGESKATLLTNTI